MFTSDWVSNLAITTDLCHLQELVQKFSVHNYDMMMSSHMKIDPTRRKIERDGDEITQVLFSAQHADVGALER